MRQQRTVHHLFLGMVFTLVVVALCPGLRAGITPIGSISPAYNSTDPWSIVEDDLIIGLAADGAVSVSGGSDVQVGGNAYLAWLDDALGAATVTGVGSEWEVEGMMEVGAYGEGTFLVSGGGAATADEMAIGGHNPQYSTLAEYFAEGADLGGGSGQVTVTGSGSTLEAGGLNVGLFGEGTLDVNEGADVTSWSAWLGVGPGVTGTATVSGAGSTWINNGDFVAGVWGNGTLTVEDGATASAEDAYIGGMPMALFEMPDEGVDQAAGTGVVTITGTGSAWDVNDVLVVGGWGTGTLTVAAGGTVTSQEAMIGGYDPMYNTLAEYFDPNADLGGGTGTATVTGTGSTWNTDGLSVGFSGEGTLEIAAGGTVAADNTWVGAMPDTNGTVEVSGSGSTWSNTSEMVVGVWGEGHVTIEDGADANAADIYLGGASFELMNTPYDANRIPDGTGTMTVKGAGSTLDASGPLYVGYSGDGTLDVNEGGQVTAGMAVLGGGPDATGTATIHDAGSQWTMDEGLVVGAWGQGNLTISDAGEVWAPEVFIGGFEVNEADFDAAMLADIGTEARGTGTVTVTGDGSTLQVTSEDSLYVGYTGNGTLNVNSGGDVTSETAGIGVMAGSTGTATVAGSGSTWDNTGSVFVGGYGTGSLTVSGTGHVDIGNILYIGGFDDEEMGFDTETVGYDPNGTGTVTVTGSGTTLEAAGIGVGVKGNGTLQILSGAQVQAQAAVVGINHDGVGLVTVNGEGSTWRIQSSDETMEVPTAEGEGDVVVSNGGQVIVDGNGVLIVSEDVTVGSEGEGTLAVSDGGTLRSDKLILSGSDPNYDTLAEYFDPDADLGTGTGEATVTGAGSTVQADTVMVGFSGEGSLEITAGGQVMDSMGMIGVVPDATGTVLVSGPNSVWTNNANLVVGAWGQGDLTIAAGARVTAPDVYIGGMPLDAIDEHYNADYIPDGTGTVTVTGGGSILEVSNPTSLYVGYFGNGTLDVNEGGRVTSPMGVVGGGPDAVGTVTIHDTNSVWDVAQELIVGAWGDGHMTISEGGDVTAETMLIGGFDLNPADFNSVMLADFGDPEGTGTVTVTGDGSTLDVSGNRSLYVGYTGNGTLNILEGGLVTSDVAGIAALPGSTGRITVDDPVDDTPSEWHNTGPAFVGGYGTGSLTVSGGGLVDIENTLFVGGFDPDRFNIDTEALGGDPNGTGTVTVTGQGSILYGSGLPELWVGYSGNGTLDVNDGGYVEAGFVGVGALPGSVGHVTVDGMADVPEGSDIPSHLNVLDAMFVGGYDTGTMTVSGGGEVTVGSSLSIGGFDPSLFYSLDTESIGYDPNGTGTVTVMGNGSLLQVASPDTLYVGYNGNGTLNVTAGGEVLSQRAYVGHEQGSEGTVVVTGEGSKWTAQGPLYVGNYGDATMTVSDGGEVFCEKGKIARQEGSEATVTVTGEGSRWVAEDDIYVGGGSSSAGGTGVLVVRSGGEVEVGNEMIVWSTGTLTGDGTVLVNSPATLYNYGTIAPGNSIGTLTVEGTVVFEPNSTFEVEIANDGTSDKLDVTGNVNIVGGTVKAIAAGTIVGSHEYQIIEADSVTGEFDTLNTALVQSVTDANLGYDETSVWLRITAMAFDDPNVWRTRNQRAVGEALQQIAEVNEANPITEALQGLDDFNDVRHSYDQLCGQIRPTLAPITTAGTNRFMGTVSDRMHGGLMSRSGSFGARQASVMTGPTAALGSGRTYEASPYGQVFAVGNGSSILGDKPWGLWGKGYGLFGDRESKDGVTGYQYRTYGFGMGADYQVKEGLLVGVTLGFSDSQADYFASRDESNADAFHVGIYGRHTRGAWYVDGLLTYSNMGYSTDRYVDLTSEHLVGEFDGSDLGGYFETGFQWRDLEGWKINPLAGLQVSFLDVDGYTETGRASALTFADQSYESIRGSLGARAIKDLSERFLGMRTLWEVRGRWVHEFGDAQSVVDASFASDPMVVFEVADAEASRDSAVLGTGFNARINASTRISVDYDVRLNSDDTTHVLGVVGEYRW